MSKINIYFLLYITDSIRRLWSLWETVRSREGHEGGGLMVALMPFYEEEEEPELPLSFEDIASRWPSINQKMGPHQTSNMPAHWPWTPQSPELREINVYNIYCLRHTGYSILLKQPKLTKIKAWAYRIKTHVDRQLACLIYHLLLAPRVARSSSKTFYG